MGITRIVEGEIINTSTAMNLTANDGDYTFNAAQKNQWKGEEEGIEEGDYTPANKQDTLSNSMNVSLNLFFDGTQNNKTNTEARLANAKAYHEQSNKDDDSYENDFTNVARAYDAIDPYAENQVAVYIEGMGTDNLQSDTLLSGVGMGTGSTGVVARVFKGCQESAKEIRKKIGGKQIDYLYINVYGFSRGAAAARHFIHIASSPTNYATMNSINNGFRYSVAPGVYKYNISFEAEDTKLMDKYGYFGACLLKEKLKIKKIIFNFIGIYDTVASYGIGHYNDVGNLELNSVRKARYVFHIASYDEYRENFDLTNINSAGLNGLELKLPGVHSDIGGSYRNNTLEISVVDNQPVADQTKYTKEKVFKQSDPQYDRFKKILIEEGWFTDQQLTKQFFWERDLNPKIAGYKNDYNYGLVGRRKLFNTYDKIPLDLMIEKTKQPNVDVKYNDIKLKRNQINDSFIASIYNQLKLYYNEVAKTRNHFIDLYQDNPDKLALYTKNYIAALQNIDHQNYVNMNDLHKLHNRYLHWSVKSNLFGLSARKECALPQHKRKRETHNG